MCSAQRNVYWKCYNYHSKSFTKHKQTKITHSWDMTTQVKPYTYVDYLVSTKSDCVNGHNEDLNPISRSMNSVSNQNVKYPLDFVTITLLICYNYKLSKLTTSGLTKSI